MKVLTDQSHDGQQKFTDYSDNHYVVMDDCDCCVSGVNIEDHEGMA